MVHSLGQTKKILQFSVLIILVCLQIQSTLCSNARATNTNKQVTWDSMYKKKFTENFSNLHKRETSENAVSGITKTELSSSSIIADSAQKKSEDSTPINSDDSNKDTDDITQIESSQQEFIKKMSANKIKFEEIIKTSFGKLSSTIAKPLSYKQKYQASRPLIVTEKYVYDAKDYAKVVLSAFLESGSYGDLEQLKISKEFCPIPINIPQQCDPFCLFRSMDGTCNNIHFPWYGAEKTTYKRFMRPHYQDGINAMRSLSIDGSPLPNPRFIAVDLYRGNPTESVWTNYMISFGQAVTHDMTGSESYGDWMTCTCADAYQNDECSRLCLDNYRLETCMPFLRNLGVFVDPYTCRMHPREQRNRNTAYLDLSIIYTNKLTRAYVRGELLYSVNARGEPIPSLKFREGCQFAKNNSIFNTGDPDAEQNIYLTSVETMWLRNHNYLAALLRRYNFPWVNDDELLFQHARRINIALYQHVVYKEFIPNLIGLEISKKYDLIPKAWDYYMNYDPQLKAQVYAEFTAGGFRHHNLINNKQCYADKNYNIFACSALRSGILDSSRACYSLDDVTRGLLASKSYYSNPQMSVDLNYNLLNAFDSVVVKNIMRGRDHGLRSYVAIREYCGLGRARRFDDLIQIPAGVRQNLKRYYRFVEDIDLWVGGTSELPLPDGMVGPTFACLAAKQFRTLKRGDRFYYENGDSKYTRFSPAQLDAIRSISVASILCANTDIGFVAKWPFLYQDPVTNPMLPCSQIPYLDLKPWLEGF